MIAEDTIKAADAYAVEAPKHNDILRTIYQIHKSAFITGAEWSLRRAWHPAEERPANVGKLGIIMLYDNGNIGYISPHQVRVSVETDNHCVRWAYIEDLIPEEV